MPSHAAAYGAHALVAASALILSLMNVAAGPLSALDASNVMGELVRGTLLIVAPLALLIALVSSARLRRDRTLVVLAVAALLMVAAITFERSLSPTAVNAAGLIYGATGLALSARWFLARRRATPDPEAALRRD